MSTRKKKVIKRGWGEALKVEGLDCRSRGFRWQQSYMLSIRQWKLLQDTGDASQWNRNPLFFTSQCSALYLNVRKAIHPTMALLPRQPAHFSCAERKLCLGNDSGLQKVTVVFSTYSV